jgi:probable HAF family extracellular repeat protein
MKRLTAAVAGVLTFTACQDATEPEDPAVVSPAFKVAKSVRIIDLGTLPGGTFSRAFNINNRGQIVGSAETDVGTFPFHVFLWEKGTMTDLGLDAPSLGTRFPLNERGQVVVEFAVTSPDADHAALLQHGTMTDLGTLGGCCTYIHTSHGINERGQVVGSSETALGEDHAFLWERGTMTDLGTLGGAYSRAVDINERGQVVGYSTTASGETHAYLWEKGSMTDLGTLGGTYSSAIAINNRGQVVGESNTTAFGDSHAFLWEKGSMTDLGTLGGTRSSARAINERGQVVGTSGGGRAGRAFLWERGAMTDLGTLGGGVIAIAINNRGQVVGESQSSSPVSDRHAFLWEKGTMTDLGTLGGTLPLGGTYSSAVDINERGQVVGWSLTVTGELHAVLWMLEPDVP